MLPNRRKFLQISAAGTVAASALGAYWLSTTKRGVGRLARMLVSDAERDVLPAPLKPDPNSWNDNAISIAWLGHSTTLINFFGVKILTDPALAPRIGVSLGIGTIGLKRFVAPALTAAELPKLDLVLLSHAHMDHMDLPTLRRCSRLGVVRAVSARATSDVLSGTGLSDLTELRWGEKARCRFPAGELEIEAFEVKHWGRRWPSSQDRGYNGYVLRREGKAILFGGDTARTPLFSEIRSRGPFEAAILPIGAYRPWIWNHCTPEEAVGMANLAGAGRIVPVHHQTFRLSDEPMEEPIQRFQAALSGEKERIGLTRIGETFVCGNS
ncbi:MAG: MBL fold metallo-hydrolase [Verrucomicrobiota bacterium]